jgi:drug/metabolite transporter (DMT)-like permease
MTVLLAVLAALVYGAAVAVQHREAAAMDATRSLRPRLLLGLMVRPLWLLGLLGDVGGFALQTAALTLGSLVVVQPILTLSLVVSLMLGARFDARRLQAREWRSVAGLLAGLSMFLVVARPTSHSDAVASPHRWFVTLTAVSGLALFALVVGKTRSGPRRGMWFALAAACTEGLMAVFAKAFGDRLGHGVASTFASWQPYAVAICGIVTMILVQSAYQVGTQNATLPMLTVAEPIIAVTLGAVLFDEQLHLAGWRAPVVVISVAVMLGCLALIASRSVEPGAYPGQP